MNITNAEMQALETHSQVREAQEMQNIMLRLTQSCFNTCSKDFLSGKVSETERECLSNCSQKFWCFFNRAQAIAQHHMQLQMTQLENPQKEVSSAPPSNPPTSEMV